MHFILSIIFCFIFGFLFWFIGHVTLKKLNILNEDNQLLLNLLRICIGTSSLLIVINLFGNILKDFNWALIISFGIILGIIIWQLNDFKQTCLDLKDFFKKANFQNFFKTHTDKYFWILFGGINFIYGLTAFSTVKLDRFAPGGAHVYNINQLLAGTYPLKYSFLPNIPQRYHYGSDIFGALISKFSGLHPEISLDILTLIFLNLSLLALYALTIKFLNTNPVNKYLVPFTAFLGWGPITLLFKTNPGEIIPTNFLDKINYLTQTRLIDAASWSGLTLHWFFAPPIGFSIFFFLIALYLLFRFFEGEQGLKFTLLLGVFLSSFVILDFSKFVILLFGTLVYLFFTLPIGEFDEKTQQNKTELKLYFKKLGILIISSVLLGLIYGNFLSFNKAYIPLSEFYNFSKTNMESKFSPFGCNIILLSIFIFGFYKAFKEKNKWINHLIPFFAVSLILPYLVTIQDAGIGKILMCSGVLGAFVLPFTIDSIKRKFDFKEQPLTAFYTTVCILLSFSTIMYWCCGDKNKPLFVSESGKLKYTGKQIIPFNDKSEEFTFAQKLKSKHIKDSSILSEPQYNELLTINSGLLSPWPILKFSESNPVKKEFVDLSASRLNSLFTLNSKSLQEEKINLLYLTPKLVRYMFSPQARQAILNITLNNDGKLIHSNNKEDLSQLKEIYYIDPKKLSYKPIKNYGKQLKRYLDSTSLKRDSSSYLRQIAECPYFGIYNAMSNDFDGDKISDLAFFDYSTKIFSIIYGKNNQEEKVDLKDLIFTNINENELLAPIPSDYDGDGRTDIAFFSENSGRWYIRRSSDLRIDSSKWFGVYIEEIPLPADLDGDFKTDTSCFNANHGTWYSGATTNGFYNNNFGLSPLDIPVFADIDGDKKADYVIYKPDKTIIEAYLSSKSFDKQQHIELNIGDQNSRLVPEDYDGDERIDLALWTPESGEFEIAYAKDFLISSITSGNIPPAFVGCGIPAKAQGNSPTPPCATKKFKLGKVGDIPMPGDYNGDGRAEIAIFSTNTGKLEIIFSNGTKEKRNLSKYKNLTPASFIGI